MLYRAIELPSDEPIQFAGVYVLEWGKKSEPTVGFVEAEEEAINAGMIEALKAAFPECWDTPKAERIIREALNALPQWVLDTKDDRD